MNIQTNPSNIAGNRFFARLILNESGARQLTGKSFGIINKQAGFFTRGFPYMQGRINSMQKSMLQWNDMHPYSAVHVVQLPGMLEATRLQACIDRTVTRHGLNCLQLNGDRSTFEFVSGAANNQVRTIDDAENPRCALVAEIERQLNLPFEHTRQFSPFRFLVAPANDSFFLGLVYFHAVADAESVFLLLREMVSCYFEDNANGSANGFDLYPESRARLRHHSVVVARKFLSLPVQTLNLRRSHRAPCRDANNMANGFAFFSLESKELRQVVTAAKSWNITVNDLLMALLMKSLSPLLTERAQARRRRKISLGCIVNLRKDLGIDNRRVFGVYLGSFVVTHEVPAGISLRNLGTDVAYQTDPIMRH
jgi:NRPS condensation-like uncharacterized protein